MHTWLTMIKTTNSNKTSKAYNLNQPEILLATRKMQGRNLRDGDRQGRIGYTLQWFRRQFRRSPSVRQSRPRNSSHYWPNLDGTIGRLVPSGLLTCIAVGPTAVLGAITHWLLHWRRRGRIRLRRRRGRRHSSSRLLSHSRRWWRWGNGHDRLRFASNDMGPRLRLGGPTRLGTADTLAGVTWRLHGRCRRGFGIVLVPGVNRSHEERARQHKLGFPRAI